MSRNGLVYTDSDRVPGWVVTRNWVLERDNRTCQLCAAPATEVDHIWPRYWGGTDHISNLQAACSPCNKRKGNTVEWRQATAEQMAWALTAIYARAERLDEELGEVIDFAPAVDTLRHARSIAACARDDASARIARIDAALAQLEVQ